MSGQAPIDQDEYHDQVRREAPGADVPDSGLTPEMILWWPNPYLTVIIPGEPHGNPRARKANIIVKGQVVGSRVHEDPKARNWKATAQQHMEDALGSEKMIDGLVAIQIYAWKPCPRSSWRKRIPRPEVFSGQTPDLDNIEKLVKDAAKGVVYHDDRQVARVDKGKMRAEQGEAPKMVVRFYILGETPQYPLGR